MKDVLSLTRAITDTEFYSEMFEKWGEEKNILFVSPQLSGRHLYKTILPFFCLSSQNVANAITSLKRYDYKKQLLDFQIDLNDDMVDWADIIIFPFTTQPLVEEIYTRIREIKPEAKIFFSVDFNFYELSKNHPLKEIFSDESVINDVESNMYFSDMVLVTNLNLLNYIVDKVQKLQETKFKNIEGYMSICGLPLFIDSNIVLKNVEYEAVNPQNVMVVVKKQESANTSNTPTASTETKTVIPPINQTKPNEVLHTEEVKTLIEKTAIAEEKVKQKELQKKEQIAKQKDENFKKHQEEKIEKKKKLKVSVKNSDTIIDKKPTKNGKQHTATTTTRKTNRKPKQATKSNTGKTKRGGGTKKRS